MTIAVLAKETTKGLWLSKTTGPEVEILFCGSVRTFIATVADAYVDMEFDADPERIAILKQRENFPLFINAPQFSCRNLGVDFIRLNGWPGFFERPLLELVAITTERERQAAAVMNALQWKWLAVADVEGMIAARIIASIINEAYHTAAAGISSREDIDTAMKLGTGYPYGPFEWAHKIGLEKIHSLLERLQSQDTIYTPSVLMKRDLDPETT